MVERTFVGSSPPIGFLCMPDGRQIARASGYTSRKFCPDAVHHMYAHTVIHRP